ncbi:hypothetical protein HDU96_001148 [Phlyctochytrium bullatum]|nr:hypothetical protein HDU96_001148 [Phlyctochytrium bullatum]
MESGDALPGYRRATTASKLKCRPAAAPSNQPEPKRPSELPKLRACLKDITQKLSDVKAVVAAQASQLDDTKDRNKSFVVLIAQLWLEAVSAKKAKHHTATEFLRLSSEALGLRAEAEAKMTEIAELRMAEEAKDSELSSLREKNSELQAELAMTAIEQKRADEVQGAELASLRKTISDLQAEADANSTELDELSRSAEVLEAELASLRKENSELRAEAENKAIDAVNFERRALASEAELDQVRAKISDLEQRAEMAEEKKGQADAMVIEANNRIADTEAKLLKTRKELFSANDLLAAMEAKLKDARYDKAQLQRDLAFSVKVSEGLELELASARNDLNKAVKSRNTVEADLDRARCEIQGLNLSSLKIEEENAKAMSAANEKLAAAQVKIRSLEQNLHSKLKAAFNAKRSAHAFLVLTVQFATEKDDLLRKLRLSGEKLAASDSKACREIQALNLSMIKREEDSFKAITAAKDELAVAQAKIGVLQNTLQCKSKDALNAKRRAEVFLVLAVQFTAKNHDLLLKFRILIEQLAASEKKLREACEEYGAFKNEAHKKMVSDAHSIRQLVLFATVSSSHLANWDLHNVKAVGSDADGVQKTDLAADKAQVAQASSEAILIKDDSFNFEASRLKESDNSSETSLEPETFDAETVLSSDAKTSQSLALKLANDNGSKDGERKPINTNHAVPLSKEPFGRAEEDAATNLELGESFLSCGLDVGIPHPSEKKLQGACELDNSSTDDTFVATEGAAIAAEGFGWSGTWDKDAAVEVRMDRNAPTTDAKSRSFSSDMDSEACTVIQNSAAKREARNTCGRSKPAFTFGGRALSRALSGITKLPVDSSSGPVSGRIVRDERRQTASEASTLQPSELKIVGASQPSSFSASPTASGSGESGHNDPPSVSLNPLDRSSKWDGRVKKSTGGVTERDWKTRAPRPKGEAGRSQIAAPSHNRARQGDSAMAGDEPNGAARRQHTLKDEDNPLEGRAMYGQAFTLASEDASLGKNMRRKDQQKKSWGGKDGR